MKKLFYTFLLIFTSYVLNSQVSGTVTGANGEPLFGLLSCRKGLIMVLLQILMVIIRSIPSPIARF